MKATRSQGVTARKSLTERSAPLHKEIARRRTGTAMSPRDVSEQVDSLIYELTLQGMERQAAAGLVVRMAKESAAAPW